MDTSDSPSDGSELQRRPSPSVTEVGPGPSVAAASPGPSNAPATGQGPSQADSDRQLIGLWLHGKSENTREAYRRDLGQFASFLIEARQHEGSTWQRGAGGSPAGEDGAAEGEAGKDEASEDEASKDRSGLERFFASPVGIRDIKLQDLQDWDDYLKGAYADSSRSRKIATVKSLFTFAQKIGYVQFNVGAVVEVPNVKNELAQKIMTQSEMQRILAMEDDPRNGALLRLMYATGARVSEITGLQWRDLVARESSEEESGQVTLYGKGGKTRNVTLPPPVWTVVMKLKKRQAQRGWARPDDPVFMSNRGNAINRVGVWRIVTQAAVRAGVKVYPKDRCGRPRGAGRGWRARYDLGGLSALVPTCPRYPCARSRRPAQPRPGHARPHLHSDDEPVPALPPWRVFIRVFGRLNVGTLGSSPVT